MATLLEAVHLRIGPLIKAGLDLGDRMAEREHALDVYRHYAGAVDAVSVRHVDLGFGSVPSDRGTVQPDAVLACVHAPAKCRAGATEGPAIGAARPIRSRAASLGHLTALSVMPPDLAMWHDLGFPS